MKKTSVIIIPIAIILLLIAGAFIYRTRELNARVSQSGNMLPQTYEDGSKPDQGLGATGVSDSAASAQTEDLTKELNGTVDDGGAEELQTLKNQAAQL